MPINWDSVANWTVWFALFAMLIWSLIQLLKMDATPLSDPAKRRRSLLYQRGLRKHDCVPCGGMGATDLTRPGHILSGRDLMVIANQMPCACCAGIGFHWVRPEERTERCA